MKKVIPTYIHPSPFLRRLKFARLFLTCLLSTTFFFFHLTASNIHPFQVSNNLILCEATVDGKQVLLVLDSGAPGLVLNSQYYTSNQYSPQSCSGINGNFNCETRRVKNWEWLGINFKSSDAILADLSTIEKVLHRKIDGLAGLSLLSAYYVELDLDARLITLNTESPDATSFSKFQYANHVPLIQCKINGRVKRLGLDTGSENNYLFASNKELDPHDLSNAGSIMVSGPENKREARQYMTMNLEINSEKTAYASGFIVDPNTSRSDDLQLDGLLGQSFLSQFNVTIHPGKQLIRFEPRHQESAVVLGGGE